MHISVLLKQSILFLVIIVFLFQPVTIDSFFKQTDYEILQANTVKDLTVVDFIAVFNDNNFTDYGFPGTGIAEDPYRIENYLIPSKIHHNGIVVINTTKHFIIQNCNLIVYWSTIFLENVSSGTAIIQNNICRSSDIGIGVVSSENVTIRSNTCYANDFGVFLFHANNSLIINNICFRNTMNGIRSQWSSGNSFESNDCSDNFNVGIEIFYDSYATVINNTCSENLRGFVIQASNSSIFKNQLNSNREYGAWLIDVNNSYIQNNNFFFNGEDGCEAENVDDCFFDNNGFVNNSVYGLAFDKSSTSNLIHHNIFIGNNVGGNSQAQDNGENNIWYDSTTKEGNYWKGWDKKKPYLIDGTAESSDKYPLNSNLERLSYHFLASILVIFMISILSFYKNKEMK